MFMGEVLVITSGKGRWGKLLLPPTLRDWPCREKVVLVVTDIGLRNLDVVMGLKTVLSMIL